MSYMNTHAAFAPAGGIQELSFDEIEEVGGGPGWAIVAGVVIVVAVVALLAVGYMGAHNKANQEND